jgi:hypothetical protein
VGRLLSPLLNNIYLNELDKFVDSLIPQYSRGLKRARNGLYRNFEWEIKKRKELMKGVHVKDTILASLEAAMRKIPSLDTYDPNYRRLRYVRYADDFLIGWVGPKKEAEEIKEKIRGFLRGSLQLELSDDKTLITNARADKATFLG